LRRESITVWTNKTDIQTGEAFDEAIKRGIEQADNLVFLLSPESVNSTYCQQELDLALSLNKRIIPILVRETDPNQVPSTLRSLQYIDLTDNVQEDDYLLDESQLLKIFHQDAAYYNEHKILLAKALKWKRQHENPSILLRGYNLRSAETWLNVAKKRTQQPPTLLQEEFIEESLRQLPLESLDVFVSYSRADSDFARKLNDSLQIQGKTTWFDQESIASGSDFQQEIYRGIKACDNFLFILSPRSVNSPYCADEVEYAASLNKRFVTVLHREVNSCDLHPELAKVQWIDFNHNKRDFNVNFNQLVRTLDTDREHVHNHTKWLQRAIEWDSKDKSADLLLRGSEFLIAQNWLQETEQQKKQPIATILQKAFIEASQNAIIAAEAEETRRQAEMLRLQEERTKEAEARLALQKKSAKRQKYFLSAVSMALVAAVGFSAWAVHERRQAQAAQKRAETAGQELINVLANSIESRLDDYQDLDGLIQGIRAGRQLKTLLALSPETRQRGKDLLQKVFYQTKEIHRFVGHEAAVISLSFSPDGKTIASAGTDGTIKLWERSGRLLLSIKGNEVGLKRIRFSPDGRVIASAGDDGTVQLWNLKGQLLHTLTEHQGSVMSVNFSPDGREITSAGEDGTIRIWNQEGKLLKSWQGHSGIVRTVAFSPDGQRIASAGDDKTVRLWERSGKLLQEFTGHSAVVRDVNFSPDSKEIVSASEDNTARLWSITGQQRLMLFHNDAVVSAHFSPDGQTIVTSSFDKTIKLWNLAGQQVQTLQGHQDWVNEATFSPDGQTIASASADTTVRLWDLTSSILHLLKNHTDWVYSVHYSPDGKLLASAGKDGMIYLYDSKGELIPGFKAQHAAPITSVQFSPDGKTIASGSEDATIQLWNLSGQQINTLKEHKDAVTAVRFSPDGQMIASASKDSTIKLWNRQGQLLKTLTGHKEGITNVSFSPDGQTIASSGDDKTVKLWSITGQLLQTLQGHQDTVKTVIFSPDGQTIISAGDDKTIRFWNRTGKLLRIARGHTSAVNNLSFSRDGKLLVSAGEDRMVKVWTPSGEPLQTLEGHTDWVNDVSFSPEGTTVASASGDKTVIIWNVRSSKVGNELIRDLSLNELLTKSCAWVSNYLQHNPTLDQSDRILCNKSDH
jgi:WD40 repeat protein